MRIFMYLGWITAAFLAGFIAAYALYNRRHFSLQNRFARIENYCGRGYREILMIAGIMPCCSEKADNGRTLRTWRSPQYSITLEFDRNNICRGVVNEQFINIKRMHQ